MSMIDTSDKSLEKSPFNDLKNLENIPENPFEGISLEREQPADRLSTRAAIFTAFIMAAVCFMTPACGSGISSILISLLWSVGAAVVYVLFWTCTLRLFENPEMMPVSIVLNLVPAVLLNVFFGDKLLLFGLVFLGAGLTALSLEAADEKDRRAGKKDKSGFTGVDFLSGEMVKYTEFIKADVAGEVLVPLVCACVSSACGVVLSELIRGFSHMQGKGLSLVVSALVLMFISFVISLIRGNDYLFSSSEMSDSCVLPVTTYKHLRSFLLRRSRFFVSIVIIGAGCLICDQIDSAFSLGFPYMKHVLSALLIFAFAFIRGRQSKHRIQFATELMAIYALCVTRVTSIGDLVLIALLATAADVLVSSFMYTRNRRLIMSSRSEYAAGMPLELITAAVVFMLVEVVAAYWGVSV